jgi:hypothetical protein
MAYCFGAWIVSFLAGVFATGMVAGATSHLGASAVGPWLLFAIALQVLIDVAVTVFLYRRVSPSMSAGALTALLIVYALGELALLCTTAFSTFVLFNR